MTRRLWSKLLAAAALAMSAAAWGQTADRLPLDMSFVAQDASGRWTLYRVDKSGTTVRVPTQLEPRQACVATRAGQAVYAAADGSLRLVALEGSAESVLAVSDRQRSFTQPCMSADGRDVYAVEMADGKSIETEIVRFAGTEPRVHLARQPGAQHEPFIHAGRWLTYASVACSDGCDRLMVEIWLRDLVAGTARQLTLLNALSQGPVTDGRRVVFSSNATGSFQLWQVKVDGTDLRRISDVPANALHPALCDGTVYFVQSSPGRSALMRLASDGTAAELAVPGLQSFRALRCMP